LEALRDRRDAREQLIRNGKTDHDIVSEWISINRYLDENARMLNFLTELSPDIRRRIIEANLDDLLANKQYTLAAEVLDSEGRMFFSWEFHYETEKYFPRRVKNPRSNREDLLQWHRQVIRERGLQVFELALAVKRKAEAGEVARRILLHCSEPDTYIDLINAAKNVGSKATVREMLKKAKSVLSSEDFARVTDTAANSDG
jgi:hypothetical protein